MSDEPPKIRLKPRLNVAPPERAAAAPTPPIPGSAPSPAVPHEASPPPPAADVAPPRPSFALRPAPSTTAPGTVAAATAKSAASSLPASSVPPPVPGGAATDAAQTGAGATPEANRKVQRVALIIGAAGVVVFGVIAAIAYPRLIAETKAYSAAEERAKSAPMGEEETSEPVAATRPQGSEPTPKPAAKPVAAKPAQPAPVPVSAPAAPAHAAAAVPVAPTGSEPRPAAAGPASASTSFSAWVANVKISGVRGGAAPRILIGRASFNLGEVVNEELGITFDGYDADRHIVRFRDRTGATAERRDR